MPRYKPILGILAHRSTVLPADRETATRIQEAIGPVRTFPQDQTVLDLFSECVATAPNRPALRYRDVTMTYAELDNAANATATWLMASGVSPNSLVPVLVTEGPCFPIALLAVLKAGSAFVPLDPAWPIDRLRAIMAELRPTAILAPAAAAAALTELGLSSRALLMDHIRGNDDETLAARPPPSPGTAVDRGPAPSDLVYGFYTSGSTGAPKCALNRHRGVVNRLTAMSRRFGDGADHITLQNSRSTFDSAMWQVLWPLISGGQVVLPHRDGILDLEQTAVTIGRYGVTITDFVPSVLAAFVSLLELRPDLRDATSGLRRMLIGGEAASPSVVSRLRKLLPELKVTNTYGPTECSIGSVFHDIGDADLDRVPLGRPIDNTVAIVLDERCRPVAAGAFGEIYLGGECLGAGYLNDAERTATVFVYNPFSEITGELLYRTGDLGTVDGDGQLHYLGRRDDQVKIGGVRIELGDVATAMAAHPMVGNAMAVVLDLCAGPTLVCCVSPRRAGQLPLVSELREFAAERLPAELLPNRIVVLDALPVNRNGKADRRALASLLAAEEAVHTEAPGNAMEELVHAAWQEVLGLTQVSVSVPLSEYGGTSLTVYQLAVAISARLGTPVRPRDLLTNPTIREQAGRLTAGAPDERADLASIASDLAWLPPKVVLLTGGTGFIGVHLLAELLCHSSGRLICLVRAADERQGAQRLIASLEQYDLTAAVSLFSMAVKAGRLEVVVGDLGRERFGMSSARFDALASSVTDVVHAGAMINFLAGYADHRSVNVVGVQELIKLAALGNGCRLHVLSTLSIFPLSGDGLMPMISEHQFPASDRVTTDGYGRSKYVAERLLENARADGVSSVVYRLGEVWPHREVGLPNPTSVTHNLLYACARTGCVFDTDAVIDVTPVDVVSQFVTRCVIGEVQIPDGTVHVMWPATLRFDDMFAVMAARGDLERVGYPEFCNRLGALADLPESDKQLGRLRVVLPPAGPDAAAPPEFQRMFTASGRYFTTNRFDEHSASMPPPPADLMETLGCYLTNLAAGTKSLVIR